jgi:ABC-type transport system substrate-binding protein
MQYKSPALDQLLQDAAGTVDKTKRKDLYFKIQDQINEDAPSIPLHIWNAMWVRNKRVNNYSYPNHMGPAIVNSGRPLINEVFVSDSK